MAVADSRCVVGDSWWYRGEGNYFPPPQDA